MTMSLLEHLFAPGTIERLGWMLVHVLWQATAVAILLAIFLRLLRSASANIRYGAACSALALMVALPLATMRFLKTPGPVAEAGPASIAVVSPAVTEGATPKRSLSVPDSGYAPNSEDTLKASLSVPPIAHVPEPMAPIPLRERLVSALEPALPYVVLGWLIGVFGLSAWHLGGWTQLQRLKRRMVREIRTPLQRRLEELSVRLGLHRAVGLLESALVEVPTVVGWLRPVILLPASALTGLRPEQLEAILAHELAHIRRYDYLVNMLQTVVEILGFYHPAVWWVSHRIREERENCCDDLAVYVCGSSLQYAKALACMEEIRHGGTDLAVAATGGSLMARIARLLGRPAVEDRRFAWLPGLITLLLVIGIVVPAAFTLGAGNLPQSSVNTGEDYQALRREHVALLSRPEVQLHEARTAVRLFRDHQDWEGLALAYQAAAQAMWRAIHQPVEAFVRPVPPPEPPVGRYPVAEVQTELDGVWQPTRSSAASWTEWIQRKQKDLVLERIETLTKLAGLYLERPSAPARAVEALQAAGREVPLFEEPLDKLISQMWPQRTVPAEHVLALDVAGAEEIRVRVLSALANAQVAAGDPHGAAETRLRAMLGGLIGSKGDWNAYGPAQEADAFWQVVRRLPSDEPLPPMLWLHVLDRDQPALDFPAPEAGPHGLPYSFPGPRLVIRPGQTAQTLTVSADMETPGGSGGVRCFTMIGNSVRDLGTVAWHRDNRPGREWRTASFNVPENAGVIRLEITPYDSSVFHVHELKVSATFTPAQAAPASPSATDAAGQAGGQETDPTRAEAETNDTSAETGQVLLTFKMAKVWSDLRPDRETLLLLAKALGVESPLAREVGRAGRPFDMTLGEILKRYIAPQPLSQPATQALLELLESRGYLQMGAQPNVLAQDNRQARIRIGENESFVMSSKLERIAYGTAVDVTPHITGDNRVALDLMVELTAPAPGVEDSNQPKVSRTSAETSMVAPNDRYLIWAAMEQAASATEADKGRQSLYVMVKPVILQPAPRGVDAADDRKPTQAHRRQILLDVRTVTMERGAPLNLNVEWGWPTVKTGVFSGGGTGTNAAPSSTWPYGVRIGYAPDGQFTDSLLAALDQLQKNGQAQMSGQQILAQEGRKAQIKALTEEWYTVTAQATKPSPQAPTETRKMESGTVVTITPHIGGTDNITLEAAIEVSTSLPRKESDLPLVTRRTAKNAVTIKDGGTVAVAGMADNPAGPNDKSAYETAIFVTAHLIPDTNEPAPPASPSAEPATQAPQAGTDANGEQATVTAVFADADLLIALAEMSQRTGVQITADATVKTTPVTAEITRVPLDTALPQVLKNTPYASRKLDDGTFLVFRPLSFTFPQVELVQALQDLSTAASVPIVPDPNVTGSVNATFQHVSLDEALEMLLAGKPYVFKRMPRYYLVADRSINSRVFQEVSETRRVRLNYIQATRAKALLSPVFAPYVQVESSRTQDPGDKSHTLIVTAPPALADRIVADIKQIDRPGKQVLLEAHVVAIEPNEIPNLGVAWAWPPVRSLLFSSGGKREIQTPIGHLLDRSATDSLMMTLNLLQENSRADIIANPKVVALDGRQAQMKLIEEQWLMMTAPGIQDDSPARPELRRLESGTVLAITPQVGDHNDITLVLAVAVNDSLPSTGGSQQSFAARHEITDSITLRDGGTVGVARVVRIPPKSRRQTATLADLPLIGELLKTSDKPGRELVVFVTAHLVPDTGRVPLPTAASVETKTQTQRTTSNASAEQAPTADESASRAWYILRQWNCPPLLLGLTQQLAKVLEPSQRNGPAWQEVTNGGTLRLKLDVEGELPGEVLVGLFQDARWSAPPVAVRRLRAGTHVLTGLPAGQYQIGAMLGNAPLPLALGVHRTWPAPVEIKAGRTATAEVLVSEAFQQRASGWYNADVAKDYVGAWGNLDEGNLLQGRLTGPGGRPIPFGEIMIREHRTDKRGFAAPNRGTNEQGLYQFDEMAWPYQVTARWRELLPSAFGCRYQTASLNRVLEGSQRVDFRFEPFPQGTAKLAGRVLDQKGRPVEGFFLRLLTVSSDTLRQEQEPDGRIHTYTGYDVPFVSPEGNFELSGLPEGVATAHVIPFEGRRYKRNDLKDVTLTAGQTTKLDFQLTGKDVFYGRVLFEDGTPAVVRPTPWSGAVTRILSPAGYRAMGIGEVDAQGYFPLYLDSRQREALATGRSRLLIDVPTDQQRRWKTAGEFPFEKLAEDKNKAGVMRVPRPQPTPTLPLRLRQGGPLPSGWRLDYHERNSPDSRRRTDAVLEVRLAASSSPPSLHEEQFELYGPDGKHIMTVGPRSISILDKAQPYTLICVPKGDRPPDEWPLTRDPFALDLSRPGRYVLTVDLSAKPAADPESKEMNAAAVPLASTGAHYKPVPSENTGPAALPPMWGQEATAHLLPMWWPEPWGEAVEGVQIRLRVLKRYWRADEIPAFRWDARNTGSRQYLGTLLGQRGALLEVDGVWYVWPAFLWGGQLANLGVGQSLENQLFTLSAMWSRAQPEELQPRRGWALTADPAEIASLQLAAGKHTIRLAVIVEPSRAATGDAFRVVSAPLDIMIASPEAGPAVSWPHDPTLAQGVKEAVLSVARFLPQAPHPERPGIKEQIAQALTKSEQAAALAGNTLLETSVRQMADALAALQKAMDKNPANVFAEVTAVGRAFSHLMDVFSGEASPSPQPGKSADLAQPPGDASHDNSTTSGASVLRDPESSRAWYIMRQLNGAPLLLGLTQQLLKVLQPTRQSDAMWQEVAGGGSLKLDVRVERETGREIVVGLFRDAKWSQEPVAVRLLPKEGAYTLTGLPAGQYQIGAMIGRAPSAAALGVQRTWPEAIEIQPGRTTEAQLLVARDFAFNASGWHNREVSRDYTGDWSLLHENHLLQGRLTGPDGTPIPFGRVGVREYQAVRTDSFAAPQLGTNEAGLYKFDGMKWPYRVGATWTDTLPDLLGCRYQHKSLERVFEGPQQVDFRFDPFPMGMARIAGRVVEEQGAAVTMFRLCIRTLESSKPAQTGGTPDSGAGVSTTYEYVVPFLSADGSFTLGNLPAGRVAVNALAFDYRPYRYEKEKEVVLENGKTAEIRFEMVHNRHFYGRVLLEDGRPAVISPTPWEGARTTIEIDETMPFGRADLGRTRHEVAEVDAEGRFCVYFPDTELEGLRSGSAKLRIRLPGRRQDEWQSGGAFPFEKLAEDKAQAGTITIRPPST